MSSLGDFIFIVIDKNTFNMATNPLIAKLITEIDKSNGMDLFSSGSKKRLLQESFSPTGISNLDFNLKTFGMPRGIIEVQGMSQSGKTTFSYMCMRNHQRKWKDQAVCFVLSSERRDNMPYAKKIGVDVENVIVIKSVFLEDLMYKLEIKLDEVEEIFSKAKIEPKVMIVLDSVSATLSRSESMAFDENVKAMKKSLDKGTKMELKHSQPGAFAKQSKMHLKSLLARMYDNDIKLIAINHTLEDFDTGKEDSGGGTTWKYLPTIRLMLKNVENIKYSTEKDSDIVAQKVKITVMKNDFGPKLITFAEILHGVGFVLSQDDIDFAIEEEILEQEGAKKISFMNGKMSWVSKRTFHNLYHDKNKFMDLLHRKIEQARYKKLEQMLDSAIENEDNIVDDEDDAEVTNAVKKAVSLTNKPKIQLIPKK